MALPGTADSITDERAYVIQVRQRPASQAAALRLSGCLASPARLCSISEVVSGYSSAM